MPLHINTTEITFTSFSCTDPVNPFLCDVTATGEVRSNLSMTPGTVDYTLVVDFSPGFDAPCNVSTRLPCSRSRRARLPFTLITRTVPPPSVLALASSRISR
jgi:hypothetical protein